MQKYYTLQLNNTYDTDTHYISLHPCTMFPNILEKEVKSLDEIDKYFKGLDNTIISMDNGYKVYGSFPVLGELINDKIYDIITKREIEYNPDRLGIYKLSYSEKSLVDYGTAKIILSLLDKKSIKKYTENLDRVSNYNRNKNKEEKYYLIIPKTSRVGSYQIIAKDINGELVDIITKKRLFILPFNAKSSHLYRDYKKEITKEDAQWYSLQILESGINEYLKEARLAEQTALEEFTTYKYEKTKSKTRKKEK